MIVFDYSCRLGEPNKVLRRAVIDLVESIKLTKIDATRARPRMGRGRHRNTAPRLPPRGDEPARPAAAARRGRRLATRRWGPGSSKVAEAWVAEMRFNTTKDGHDQMPLRKVLWRYRDVLYDFPETTQCRRCTRRTGRDPCAYLLWHNHRKKREEHKSPRTTACGYHAPPRELVLRHQHHGHSSSPSPAG